MCNLVDILNTTINPDNEEIQREVRYDFTVHRIAKTSITIFQLKR